MGGKQEGTEKEYLLTAEVARLLHVSPKTVSRWAKENKLPPLIAEKALMSLEAPINRVAGFDTPFPYTLENEYLPSPDRVALAIKQTATF